MKKLVSSLIIVSALASMSFAQGPHAKISAAAAAKAALAKYPGKLVGGKIPLENEEGKWQYGVMVQSGKILREVMVDANTGKIANVEVTTAAKEVKEKAADEAKEKGKMKMKVKVKKGHGGTGKAGN